MLLDSKTIVITIHLESFPQEHYPLRGYPDLYPVPTTNICESCYIHFGGVWPHTNSLKSEMLENSGHSEYHPFSDFFFCKTVQY